METGVSCSRQNLSEEGSITNMRTCDSLERITETVGNEQTPAISRLKETAPICFENLDTLLLPQGDRER